MFSQNVPGALSPDEIIRNQSTIRIFFDEKRGFGDLSASLKVMDGIRDTFGFDGVFQVIYPDQAWRKVKSIFDINNVNLPTTPLGRTHVWKGNQIVFISVSNFIKHHDELKTVKFGFSGSFLFTYAWEQTDEEKHKLAGEVLLNFLKVQSFIDTTPWVTSKSAPYYPSVLTKDTIYQLIDKKDYLQSTAVAFEDAKAELNRDGQYLEQSHPALRHFMDGMEQKKFNVMPVYGWAVTIQSNMLYFDQTEDATPANILSIIYGARFAQLNGMEELRNKPLVIPIFYKYDEDIKFINDIIQHNLWDETAMHRLNDMYGADSVKDRGVDINDKPKNIAAYIQNFKLKNSKAIAAIKNATDSLGLAKPKVFSFADVTQADTVKVIDNLAPNTILLLSIPELPRTVFEGIFTYTGDNILPSWREGPSLFYQLALTGKPHFRCGNIDSTKRWEPGYAAMEDATLKTKLEALYELEEHRGPWNSLQHMGLCNGMRTWEANNKIYETIGELIIESRDPQAAFSKYFEGLSKEVQNPVHNRLRILVDKALNQTAWALMPILSEEQQLKVDEQIMQDILLLSSQEPYMTETQTIATRQPEANWLTTASATEQTAGFRAMDLGRGADPAASLVAAGVAGTALLVVSVYLVARDLLKQNSLIRSTGATASSLFRSKPAAPGYQPIPNTDMDDIEAAKKPKTAGVAKIPKTSKGPRKN